MFLGENPILNNHNFNHFFDGIQGIKTNFAAHTECGMSLQFS
jgi:hypothetical protein